MKWLDLINHMPIADNKIKEIIDAIKVSKKPIIYSGVVITSNASNELTEFTKLLGFPQIRYGPRSLPRK